MNQSTFCNHSNIGITAKPFFSSETRTFIKNQKKSEGRILVFKIETEFLQYIKVGADYKS